MADQYGKVKSGMLKLKGEKDKKHKKKSKKRERDNDEERESKHDRKKKKSDYKMDMDKHGGWWAVRAFREIMIRDFGRRHVTLGRDHDP